MLIFSCHFLSFGVRVVRAKSPRRKKVTGNDILNSANQGDKVTVNKKTLYVIVAIVIVALSVVVGYLYLGHSTTNDVVITSFEKGSGYTVGSASNQDFIYPFNVTISNRGSNDVSGLTVVIQVLGNGNVLGSDTTQVGTLNAGNQYSFSASVTFSGNAALGETQTYTALLEQNGVVINQMNLS
jgi:hypothetical protein